MNLGSTTLDNEIFPLFRVKEGSPPDPQEDVGTGFLISERLLLTCWHCVSEELPEDEFYAAAKWTGSAYRILRLEDVEQSETGHDIALANLDAYPLADVTLSSTAAPAGTDVWSYGFPYTTRGALEDGRLSFQLEGRFLQGYVTRAFLHEQPGFRKGPAHELDMPTPAGMSGAPLFKVGTLEVIGMIYGSNDVEMIEQLRSTDPVTGEAQPEVMRIQSFGLAHQAVSLAAAAGTATGAVRLGTVLASHA